MAGRYPRRSSGKPGQGGHNDSPARPSTRLEATRNRPINQLDQLSNTSTNATPSTSQLPNGQQNSQNTIEVRLRPMINTDDYMDLASDTEGSSATAPAPAHLPGPRRGEIRQRDLRRSNYSLNPRDEIDSDDDDPDYTPDFVVASRLQQEEYVKADAYQQKEPSSGAGPRRSLRSVSGSVPTPLPLLPSRRARDDLSLAVSGPSGKRQKLEVGPNSGTSTPGDQNSTPVPRRSARVNGSSSRPAQSCISASDLFQAGSIASTSNDTPNVRTPQGVINALTANGATSASTPNGTALSTDSESGQPFNDALFHDLQRTAGLATRANTRSRRGPVNFISASQLFSYGNNATVPGQNGEFSGQNGESSGQNGETPEDDSITTTPPEQDGNTPVVTADGAEEDPATQYERLLEEAVRDRRAFRSRQTLKAMTAAHASLVKRHPVLKNLWGDLRKEPVVKTGQAPQPTRIHRQLKPFQLEGLAWMQRMEAGKHKGGILGDEMGLGKTIQAVSLIMSDFPARKPSLVLVPPVALMQWVAEIDSYTDNTLKTFVFHGTNSETKSMKLEKLKKYDVIIMSYNSLESMYRRQTKGHKKKNSDDTYEIHTQPSLIHKINFHRIILDEAHEIKTRNTSTAKACFALKGEYRWCLTGTPLQNVIGEFFSLIQFLNIRPFCLYVCKQCSCEQCSWNFGESMNCHSCSHNSLQHVSVFNHELLGPIQRCGRRDEGAVAFDNLLLLTDHIMLRRLKKNHTDAMQLPIKELEISRQFFTEAENETVREVTSRARQSFDAYVMDGTVLDNYASIFSLIMNLRQTADHPDLLSKKNGEGSTNILECCICESPAEDAIISKCRHHFCRACARSYLDNVGQPECPRCHMPLSVDLAQPEVEQDQVSMKKSSIINRIKRENWKSSTKIEMLVHELYQLRSDSATHKSIIFSQFTSMLQLIEWRLRHAGFTTVILDGTMTPAQRSASINHFMQNVDVECFLVSLKAGGVALNLTEASRVFIVEPWWNPAVEWQSADRCHRIGQTRPCIIKNLVIEDSVESRMILLQEKKTAMIHSTIDRDSKAAQSLTPRDMQFLFRG